MKKVTLIIAYCLLLNACITMGIKGEQAMEYVLQLSEKGNRNQSQLQEKTIEILSERLKEYGYADKQITFKVLPDKQLKVNLAAIDDSERVKKLLTERGYFSMQECFNQNEIFADKPAETIDELLQSAFQRKVDRLQKTDDTQAATDMNENPQNLFSPLFEVNEIDESGELGFALAKDTSQINRYLRSPAIKYLFPNNAVFMWSRSPDQNSIQNNHFALYAAKVPTNEKDFLDNNDILEVRSDKNYHNQPIVSLKFKESSHQKLERLSAMNVNRAILITLNNQVVSAPVVMEKLTGGAAQITGNFSEAEVIDLMNMLGKKYLPVEVKLLSEKVSRAKE
ncbi:MAG: SecDF P1 head subdomain-containing protein [Chitinophagales bacterium]